MLDSEINAVILAISTEKMQSNLSEWLEMKRADKKKTSSLWVQYGEYAKASGNNEVENILLSAQKSRQLSNPASNYTQSDGCDFVVVPMHLSDVMRKRKRCIHSD